MADIWGRFEADEPATQLSIVSSRRARIVELGEAGWRFKVRYFELETSSSSASTGLVSYATLDILALYTH